MSKREEQDIFYLKLAYMYAERSTCIRRKVGAVIVKDNVQISCGYNGAPRKIEHCNDNTCIRKILNVPSGQKHELCRGAHAEGNAIAQAAKNGINVENSTIYCTTQPCIYCAKLIVNSGIKRLVFAEPYKDGMDDLTKEMLQNVEIKLLNINKRE